MLAELVSNGQKCRTSGLMSCIGLKVANTIGSSLAEYDTFLAIYKAGSYSDSEAGNNIFVPVAGVGSVLYCMLVANVAAVHFLATVLFGVN